MKSKLIAIVFMLCTLTCLAQPLYTGRFKGDGNSISNLFQLLNSAEDYGASTNNLGPVNRQAIQNALDAAKHGNRRKMGTWLGRGDYDVSGPIYLGRGMQLYGAGDYHGDRRTILNFSGTHGIILTNSYENSIKYIGLVGTTNLPTGGICISNGLGTFVGEGVTLEQVYIKGFQFNMISDSPTRVRVEDCYFWIPGTANVLLRGLVDSHMFVRNTISGGAHGTAGGTYHPAFISDSTASLRSLRIESNEIGDGNPYMVFSGAGGASSITIAHNTFERLDSATNLIVFGGNGKLSLLNNRFGDATARAIVRGNGAGVRIIEARGYAWSHAAFQDGGTNYGDALLYENAGGTYSDNVYGDFGFTRYSPSGAAPWYYKNAHQQQNVDINTVAFLQYDFGKVGKEMVVPEPGGGVTRKFLAGFTNSTTVGPLEYHFKGQPLAGNGLNITNVGGIKVYRVLLDQASTSAPTAASTGENTIGSVSFGYIAVGVYTITITGGFTSGKTFASIIPNRSITDTDDATYHIYRQDNNTLVIKTRYTGSGGPNLSNNLMNGTYVEVLVYP